MVIIGFPPAPPVLIICAPAGNCVRPPAANVETKRKHDRCCMKIILRFSFNHETDLSKTQLYSSYYFHGQ